MITSIISRTVVILFGVLYPAYKSYKALKYRNVKEMVRLTMHWIVFAAFLAIETITDIFLTWLPFYYELKVFLVLYLALPFTQGSSIIYRKVVHPNLSKKESEIDEAIGRAADTGYAAVMQFGAKGLTYAAATVINTAIKGQDLLFNNLSHRSLSLNDLPSGRRMALNTRSAAHQASGDAVNEHLHLYNLHEMENEDLSDSVPSLQPRNIDRKHASHAPVSLRKSNRLATHVA